MNCYEISNKSNIRVYYIACQNMLHDTLKRYMETMDSDYSNA